jgi:DNA-binding response OmpR family regulator
MPQPLSISDARTILLVVEVDRELRAKHALYLGLAGFRVLQADDASEGIYLSRRYSPSLIVADLIPWRAIPISTALNPDPYEPRVPVIAMSPCWDGALLEEANIVGVECVMPRQCALPELLLEIRSVLDGCRIWRSYAEAVRQRSARCRSRSEALLERSRELREKFRRLTETVSEPHLE